MAPDTHLPQPWGVVYPKTTRIWFTLWHFGIIWLIILDFWPALAGQDTDLPQGVQPKRWT
jgi:hypothetical protein